jgi:CDP-diglyceride synthetase
MFTCFNLNELFYKLSNVIIRMDANLSKWPTCLIIPSKTGSTTNCLTVPMPSMSKIIMMLIIGWILFMVVAYIIYYFLNRNRPINYKYSYWIILLVLILAGIIVSLINTFIY